MIEAIDFLTDNDLPPEKEFIVQDWLAVEDISFLKGERGVGKSLLVQQLMTAVATGKPWLNMDVKQVKTYGVFCKDKKKDLICRQRAINRLYQLDKFLVEKQMRTRPGNNNVLMTFSDKNGGELTTFFHEVLEDIRSFQPKLVVLDSDLFDGDPFYFEQFVQCCCAYISKVLCCAVLVCAEITIGNNRVWHLARSDEVKDERTLYCGESTHLLRYQDGVFKLRCQY